MAKRTTEVRVASGPTYYKGRDLLCVAVDRGEHMYLLIYDPALSTEAYFATDAWVNNPELNFQADDQWWVGLHIETQEDTDGQS